ncbi:MAG TPA: 16S rRNA pseudouridine(516) synthase RsuA [Gammaproteobacteria bacterium]
MRLDRYLSQATTLSRAQAQRAIRTGLVTVDGAPARDPAMHLAPTAQVALEGRPLVIAGPRYFMLHKPAGYLCATQDGAHPTVLDLLHEPRRNELHIAGRLDLDTTGLVLISDDGHWSHRITAPRRECPKRYRVTLAEDLAAGVAEQFAHGVQLKGEAKPTRPAQLEIVSAREVFLTIHEGKYHQVKRMFAAVGNHVIALHRVSIGAIVLDATLPPGGYRPLRPEEIAVV